MIVLHRVCGEGDDRNAAARLFFVFSDDLGGRDAIHESQLGFGRYFTNRMLLVEWKAGRGWYDARIKPYEAFVLDPACMVFHYA